MANEITVTLSEHIATEVKRIAEILGLSLNQCTEYLIQSCLDLYNDIGGDTMRLIGLAEGLQYPTPGQARTVAERIEMQAVQNHLEHPDFEMLISMEVVKHGDSWKFKTDQLRGDKWKDIDARDEEPPLFS